MYSIEGPHKIAIDALQKQIDLRFKEINELRSTQNSHVPVSRLPAELLSQVFLYIVESGLQPVDLGFAWGTFGFRRVCKRWNEVAVGFPHLWARWASSAFVVWGLFNARSKGVPISLTWRPSYDHIRHGDGVLADPTIPGRIRTFDCTGTQDRLEHLLGTFTSDHFPIASSIRLHVTPYDEHGPKENTAAFLSLPFPKLSRLDIKNSLPGSSSPIFTTSNLVSLKLGVPYIGETQHTRSQFSQILQRHSNLQELHLWQGGMPQVDPSEPPAPVILPQLVDLRLYGNAAIIAGFMVLLDMSSPLHNVVIDLEPTSTTTSGLTNAVKKILVLYYECQGLDFPRTADHLTVPSRPQKKTLVFNVESRPTSASDPTYSFELRLGGVDDTLGREICPLFPLDHVREFSVTGLSFSRSEWRGMFEKMEGLVHLQLDKVNLGPAMGALGSGDELKGVYKESADAISNSSNAYSRVARTTHPEPAIVDTQEPRHPPRPTSGIVGNPVRPARRNRLEEFSRSVVQCAR